MLVTQAQQQKLIDLCAGYNDKAALAEVLQNTCTANDDKYAQPVGLTLSCGVYVHILADGSSHT